MSTAPAWFNSVKNATSLDALKEALQIVRMRGYDAEEYSRQFEILMTELPTFGGDEVSGYIGEVYSWDETRVLVDGASGWELQDRVDLGV